MAESGSLSRFVEAQAPVYAQVLRELQAGRKSSHWMWFIFPQIGGLGRSQTAQFYAISGMREARDYLQHPVLAPRLAECTDAMLAWSGKRSTLDILGAVDAQKFASSMTLFEAAEGGERYAQALEAFNGGKRDQATLKLLSA